MTKCLPKFARNYTTAVGLSATAFTNFFFADFRI